MKDKNGVEIASPAIEEELDEELDENGNPIDPSSKGKPDVDKDKEVDERGVELTNVTAENERKQQVIDDLKVQNEKLIDSLVSRTAEPETPDKKMGVVSENDYTGLEGEGLSKAAVDKINDMSLRRFAEYDEKFVIPNERRLIQRANNSDVNLLVSEDKELKPYKQEIKDELKNMSFEDQSGPEAAFKASQIVKANHMDDIIKKVKSETRKEVKTQRQILSDNPSGTAIKTDSGTVTLTAEQKAMIKVAGITEEDYAKSVQRYQLRKTKEHKVPGA